MKIKKLLAFLLCLTLVPLNVPLPVARADDSDIFGANIEPNIMIFVDTSGSMADEIPASPYDPATTYTGSKTVTTVYKKTSSGYGVYKTSIADVTSSSARTALSTVGYWSGKIGGSKISLYMGNYLNYTNSSAGAQVAKMTIAKRVIGNVINTRRGCASACPDSPTTDRWAAAGQASWRRWAPPTARSSPP